MSRMSCKSQEKPESADLAAVRRSVVQLKLNGAIRDVTPDD
jgi:hypothetical protein